MKWRVQSVSILLTGFGVLTRLDFTFGPEFLLKLYLPGAIGGSVFYLVHHAFLAASLKSNVCRINHLGLWTLLRPQYWGQAVLLMPSCCLIYSFTPQLPSTLILSYQFLPCCWESF